MILTHGIPHNPTGQVLVECAHHILKMCLLKQNLPHIAHVNNAFNIALFTINALNVQCEDNTHHWSSALDRHFTLKEPLSNIYVKYQVLHPFD